jgi:pimeloyl-ACP methyl ester carboxylesterase
MGKESSPKPLALLIPGLDGTGLLYSRHIEALSRQYRVMPCRFRNGSEFDYPDLMDELDMATQDEEPDSILVVGESFGGTVAMHYALLFPERIDRLFLINTFPYYRRRLRINLARILTPLLKIGAARRIKDSFVDLVLRLEGIPKEARREYHYIIESEVDLGAYRQRLNLVARVDLRKRLGEITIPASIFASGRDKLVPSMAEARLMASSIPQAVLHEFSQAGHALLLTPGFSLADYLTEGIKKKRSQLH